MIASPQARHPAARRTEPGLGWSVPVA